MRAIMGRGRTRLFDTRPAERNGDEPANAGKGHETRNITWTHYYAKEDVYSRIDYILISHGMEHGMASRRDLRVQPAELGPGFRSSSRGGWFCGGGQIDLR